jgi:hypothetical protein
VLGPLWLSIILILFQAQNDVLLSLADDFCPLRLSPKFCCESTSKSKLQFTTPEVSIIEYLNVWYARPKVVMLVKENGAVLFWWEAAHGAEMRSHLHFCIYQNTIYPIHHGHWNTLTWETISAVTTPQLWRYLCNGSSKVLPLMASSNQQQFKIGNELTLHRCTFLKTWNKWNLHNFVVSPWQAVPIK